MSDRQKQLLLKKEKLKALREEKDRRRKEREQKDIDEATSRTILGGGTGDWKEVDDLLREVGVAPVSDVLSSISSANSLTPEQSRNHTPDTSLQPNSLPNK